MQTEAWDIFGVGARRMPQTLGYSRRAEWSMNRRLVGRLLGRLLGTTMEVHT